MKKLFQAPAAFVAAFILGASLLVVSCEHDSPEGAEVGELGAVNNLDREQPPLLVSEEFLFISPSNAAVARVGQSLEFNAIGGTYPMTWRLSNSSAGTLTVVGFSQAIYTATTLGNNEIIVTDGLGHQAAAMIQNSVTFAIFPSALTVQTNATVLSIAGSVYNFTTRGGVAPYSWTLDNAGLGTLTPAGSTATYTANGITGTGTISVTDGNGNRAAATVTQTQL
jgi:hypothetical protein